MTGPVAGSTTSYTYDGNGRVRTVTTDGVTVTTDYDALDRVTRVTYPDATYEETTYDRLDVGTRRDRAGRITRFWYDRARRLVATRDPAGRVIGQAYGAGWDRLLDANGHATTWEKDLATSYSYHAAGQLGPRQIATVDGPLPDDTISYAYDQLGRVVSRAVNGVPLSLTYDALGRVTQEANALGTFTYGYEGPSGRLASLAFPNGQTSVYSYLAATQDHRLETIHHQLQGGATLGRHDYTYDAVGNILTWRQQGGPRRRCGGMGTIASISSRAR